MSCSELIQDTFSRIAVAKDPEAVKRCTLACKLVYESLSPVMYSRDYVECLVSFFTALNSASPIKAVAEGYVRNILVFYWTSAKSDSWDEAQFPVRSIYNWLSANLCHIFTSSPDNSLLWVDMIATLRKSDPDFPWLKVFSVLLLQAGEMGREVQTASLKCFAELLANCGEGLETLVGEVAELVGEMVGVLVALAESYSRDCVDNAIIVELLLRILFEFFAKEAANYSCELSQILCNLFTLHSDTSSLVWQCQNLILDLSILCAQNSWGNFLFYVDIQCMAVWDKMHELSRSAEHSKVLPHNHIVRKQNTILLLLHAARGKDKNLPCTQTGRLAPAANLPLSER